MYYFKPILKNMSMHDIVDTYISLPEIRMNREIVLTKIGIYNWKSDTRTSEQQVQYKQFTAKLPESFPVDSLQYAQADYVSPVVLFDESNIEYRVDAAVWLPLADIFDGAAVKQGSNKLVIFPIALYIDDNREWINELYHAVGRDVINALPNVYAMIQDKKDCAIKEDETMH